MGAVGLARALRELCGGAASRAGCSRARKAWAPQMRRRVVWKVEQEGGRMMKRVEEGGETLKKLKMRLPP